MARLARVVVPGCPHHVTQRGNRRMETFFGDGDYARYRAFLAEYARKADVAVWAYCLMPNHVHLILVPTDADGLRRALGETHRRYTRHVNQREEWRGHLWQDRFRSFPMDEGHLLAAARYVELNPVRARLAARPEAWPWSSARAHLAGKDDDLVSVAPLLALASPWRNFLKGGLGAAEHETLRAHERTGRPLGDAAFIDGLESQLDRALKPGRRGRRAKEVGE